MRHAMGVLTAAVAAFALVMVPLGASQAAPTRAADDPPTLSAAADGTVTARVFVQLSDGSFSPATGGSALLRLYPFFGDGTAAGAFASDSSGNIVGSVPPGSYLVEVSAVDSRVVPVHEWWNGSRFQSGATFVTVPDGGTLALGDIQLEQRTIDVSRLGGANRYETAVRLSQRAFPGTAGGVVVVNGESFADALSAGPLAHRLGGTMLLVTPTSIPAATRAEIDRLNPTSIYVVGGTSAVSRAVEEQLRPYASNPAFVYRLSGADRYETSRAVVDRIGAGVNSVFIATGRDFPDALSAAAATGATGVSALLLVDGTRTRLDSATRALLTARSGADFWVIGGQGAVSSSLVSDIGSIAPTLRLAGSDRYETSVAVAFQFFSQADDAFVANGAGFADALAAGPVAAHVGAPLYLSRQNCIPEVVLDDIFEVFANRVTLAGGTAVLSSRVAQLRQC